MRSAGARPPPVRLLRVLASAPTSRSSARPPPPGGVLFLSPFLFRSFSFFLFFSFSAGRSGRSLPPRAGRRAIAPKSSAIGSLSRPTLRGFGGRARARAHALRHRTRPSRVSRLSGGGAPAPPPQRQDPVEDTHTPAAPRAPVRATLRAQPTIQNRERRRRGRHHRPRSISRKIRIQTRASRDDVDE